MLLEYTIKSLKNELEILYHLKKILFTEKKNTISFTKLLLATNLTID